MSAVVVEELLEVHPRNEALNIDSSHTVTDLLHIEVGRFCTGSGRFRTWAGRLHIFVNCAETVGYFCMTEAWDAWRNHVYTRNVD